ncbi:MAG: bifunctional phosphopantothenoylcysteine decarboxylase/phosphopantothenate--cysteine ligase CoaBC [bacterium]|nr:bifunctional phosphopantothenoylcysteine decarboxylase/phosphopantothenate--cysteine ligase CoaBC [bacterium]MCY3632448.1 bifunctional phosphopantothenoylcysteine decarboxylase/phosphopantothenate--cysteine ligase CoaBC [bacterium]
MTSVAGKRIVLGVSGGIAAYKAVEICRRLMDSGAHVIPVLTKGATRFVGRATFDALASEPVQMSLFDEDDPIPHTTLGQTADCVLVAPATARVIGAYAAGISSDLLTATLIATRAPVVICPAMHTEMWEHPAVADNIATLVKRGVSIVGPESGRLAGGDEGAGRLSSPADIVAAVDRVLDSTGRRLDMAGLSVVVTAGGTREPIDPVRYIGNRSSGKQGYAFAEEAAARGAKVTIITTVDRPGPLGTTVVSGITVVRVNTAEEMAAATAEAAKEADVVIMAAAVADFRPVDPAGVKIKKRDGVPAIQLEPTPDILAGLGASKPEGQILVGFAAETCEVADNAAAKLSGKGADYIVANDVAAENVGFAYDTNEVTVLASDGRVRPVGMRSKRQVAQAVLDLVMGDRDASEENQ